MSRILVVEDESEIRENIQALLELEGYSVVTASNGKEAIAALQSNPSINLIFLDLSMPVMSGSEFLKEVAKNAAWVKIPVCITTGVAELPKFDRMLDILRKPISFHELLTQVRKHSPAPSHPVPEAAA